MTIGARNAPRPMGDICALAFAPSIRIASYEGLQVHGMSGRLRGYGWRESQLLCDAICASQRLVQTAHSALESDFETRRRDESHLALQCGRRSTRGVRNFIKWHP